MLTIGDFVQFNSRFYEPRNVENMCAPKYPHSMAYMIFGEVVDIDDTDCLEEQETILIKVKSHLYNGNCVGQHCWLKKNWLEKIDFSMANRYIKRQERDSLSAKYNLERRGV